MLSRVTTYILSSNCQCQSLPNDRICLLGNWQFNDLPCLRSPVYLKMSKLTGKGEERTEISGRGWFWLKQLLSRTPKYVPPLRLDSLGWENNTRWCSWHKAPPHQSQFTPRKATVQARAWEGSSTFSFKNIYYILASRPIKPYILIIQPFREKGKKFTDSCYKLLF